MKGQITLLFLLILFSAMGQNDKNLTTKVYRVYYVLDMSVFKQKLNTYLQEHKIDVSSMNVARKSIDVRFNLSKKQYDDFVQKTQGWGNPNEQTVNSENYLRKVNEMQSELLYLKSRKEEYEKLIATLTKDHAEYLGIWREIRKIDENIHRKQKAIDKEKDKHARFEIHIKVYEEKNPTEDYSRFSMVNMPGIEYSYLSIEKPKEDFSADVYQGVFLKYMFTRGKTYGLIGAFKDFEKEANEKHIDELFVFALGQDFYSRYLGRGAKMSMNLYSSFNGGYILATSEDSKWRSWYMSAFIGLELLKTKYILLDNKIGYFIPFKDSRNMRGLSYRVSFNFVF